MPRAKTETRKMKAVKAGGGIRWRLIAALFLFGILFVGTAFAALQARHFVLHDPQFQFSRDHADALTILGLQYAPRAKVQHVFSADFGRSLFSVPIAERRRRLLAIDWIEDASVSRIWPDRIAVHVQERRPVAFVFFGAGVLLIDAHGVLLDPPAQAQFTFPVLSGVREDESESQRAQRVAALLRVQQELGSQARDLSEVNASDLDNIRIVAQVDSRALEFILGDSNFGPRYQNFLSHYPEIKRRSPEVKTFDLRLDDRITAKD
jgi:cell division protein FtsQ